MTTHTALRSLLLASLLAGFGCRAAPVGGANGATGTNGASGAAVEVPDPGHLTLDEVQAKLGQPGVHVFDANPREMYDVKHVPGARWVEWNHVTMADLPADRGATLIFYCALEACSASTASAKSALRLGYSNVFTMPQGILGWKKAGKPIEKSPATAG